MPLSVFDKQVIEIKWETRSMELSFYNLIRNVGFSQWLNENLSIEIHETTHEVRSKRDFEDINFVFIDEGEISSAKTILAMKSLNLESSFKGFFFYHLKKRVSYTTL